MAHGIVAGKAQDRMAEYAPTIEEARLLRKTTPVGSHIRFKYTVDGIPKMIEGTVIAVYPNIFMLHTGKTYTWVDYMLGK